MEIFQIHIKQIDRNKYLSEDMDFGQISKNYTSAGIFAEIRRCRSFALGWTIKNEEENNLVADKNLLIK